MRGWFRSLRWRRRITLPAQPVTTQADILTAHAWGLTLTQWWSESDDARAWFRRNITQAPRFGVDR